MKISRELENTLTAIKETTPETAMELLSEAIAQNKMNDQEKHFAFAYFGQLYRSQGLFDQSVVMFEKALSASTEMTREEADLRVNDSLNLASALGEAGKFEVSIKLLEESLSFIEEQSPKSTQLKLIVLSSLALAYYQIADYNRSKELSLTILNNMEEFDMGDLGFKFTVMSNLASALISLNEVDRAKQLLEEVLEYQLNVDSESPAVAVALSNLASLLLKTGDLENGKVYLERALEISVRNFGSHHPQVITTMSNLASAHTSLGSYDKAMSLYSQAYENCLSFLGANHPTTATTLVKIAILNQNLGHLSLAESQLKEAYSIFKSVLNHSSPAVVEIEHYLKEIAQKKIDQEVNSIVRGATATGVAVSVVPGMSLTSSIQVSLIKSIASAYGQKLTNDQVKNLLTTFGLGVKLSAPLFLLPLAGPLATVLVAAQIKKFADEVNQYFRKSQNK